MSARPRSADTKVRRLRAFMADGAWYAAAALAEVGGTRFAARLHEIRNGSDGERAIDYECRAVGGSDTAFEYRLRPDLPEPEKKTAKKRQSASALIKHQAEEIARLTAELAKAKRSTPSQAWLFGGSPP